MNPFTKGKTASRTGNAVLVENDIRQIRLLARTQTVRELSDAYGVGMESIRKIIRRDSWKWVADEIDFDAAAQPLTELQKQAARQSAERLQELLSAQAAEPTGLEKLQQMAHKEIGVAGDVLDEMEEAAPAATADNPYPWLNKKKES